MDRTRGVVDWWLRDRTTGRITIAQAPNAAIIVFLLATAARWLELAPATTMRGIGTGALLVWGLDELVRGVNPLRRLLGVLVLGWQLVGLIS